MNFNKFLQKQLDTDNFFYDATHIKTEDDVQYYRVRARCEDGIRHFFVEVNSDLFGYELPPHDADIAERLEQQEVSERKRTRVEDMKREKISKRIAYLQAFAAMAVFWALGFICCLLSQGRIF